MNETPGLSVVMQENRPQHTQRVTTVTDARQVDRWRQQVRRMDALRQQAEERRRVSE